MSDMIANYCIKEYHNFFKCQVRLQDFVNIVITWLFCQNLSNRHSIWVKPGRRLRLRGQKSVCFFRLPLVLLTWYYLFWGSRWFLSNKYAEGTNLKRLSGPLHLLNLAKKKPKLGNKKKNLSHVWCPFIDKHL